MRAVGTTWAILRHAVLLLLRNLPMALRISIGPLVIVWLLDAAFGRMIPLGAGSPVPFGGASSWLLGLVTAYVMAWLAVAWHRHILLEERPDGLLPPLAGAETLTYAIWGFLIGLALSILQMLGAPALTALGAGLPDGVFLLLLFAGLTALAWLALRVGLVLPAAALGRGADLAEAWALTGRLPGVMWALAALSVAAPIAGGLALGWLPPALIGAGAAVLSWLGLLLGLCLLTTLYGHLAERRPL